MFGFLEDALEIGSEIAVGAVTGAIEIEEYANKEQFETERKYLLNKYCKEK